MSKRNKGREKKAMSQAKNEAVGLPDIQSPMKSSGYKIISWGLAVILILTLAVVFAEPQKGGDLWWQMVYGRYMLENHTLIPDHTIYSWSPTDGSHIYCAWIAEIALYLLYQTGGLPVLFVLRYLCFLLFVFLLWLHARRNKVASHPLTWLVCLIGLLMSVVAAIIKPGMFTFVLMTLTVSTWWRIKVSDEKAWQYCYVIPIIMLIWVNTHGGFVFGVFFLVLIGIGELLNRLLSSEEGLSPTVRKHLYIGLAFSGLAIFVTPYGWNYPAQLFIGFFLGGTDVAELRTVSAYLNIFNPTASYFHFVHYLILAGLTLLMLHIRKKMKRLDWTLILTNLAFGWMFCQFLRTTFYFAPIFAFSSVTLLSQFPAVFFPRKKWIIRLLNAVVIGLFLLIAGRACFDHIIRPIGPFWWGFGMSTQSPVEEAEFIKRYLPEYDKVGNDYDTGGYLIWALWPEAKIFIDPRFFPFRKWYREYLWFSIGRNVPDFLEKNKCDIWCIRLKRTELINQIAQSADWKLAYYGTSAAVFVRKDIKVPKVAEMTEDKLRDLNGFFAWTDLLTVAAILDKWEAYKKILNATKDKFKWSTHQKDLEIRGLLAQGVEAFYKGDYKKAIPLFEVCKKELQFKITYLTDSYHHLAMASAKKMNFQGALGFAKSALSHNPKDMFALFNVGTLLWFKIKLGTEEKPLEEPEDYKHYLEQFLQMAKKDRLPAGKAKDEEKLLISIAESIVDGSFKGEELVLYAPPEPTLKQMEISKNGQD